MKDPAEAQLSTTFGFTSNELAANRQGLVADGQLAPEWTAVLWSSLILVGAAFGCAAMARRVRGRMRWVNLLAATLGALLIAVVVVLPAVRDLIARTVRQVDAPVTDVQSVGKGRGHAVLLVGGTRLSTTADPAAARLAVEPRLRYRLYYLPHRERLLSLEPAP